jgi:hypothetical protein
MNSGVSREIALLLLSVLIGGAGGTASAKEPGSKKPAAKPAAAKANGATTSKSIDDAKILLAPYVWRRTGAGQTARAEATMPGAYAKLAFRGSKAVRLLVDGTANNGCPAPAMPVVDYSIDHGAFQTVQLTEAGQVYSLPLGDKLDAAKEHRLEVYFRAAGLGPERWRASTVHLRLAGIELDAGGSLAPLPARPRRAIGFGDSITEGVCNEGLCPYYSNLKMNNAGATWFPLVCTALDCEYGQLGTGGQGVVRPIEIPPLPQTWDHYDAKASRLVGGRLTPEPDYVFCLMGTNDHRVDGKKFTMLPIKAEYLHWLGDVRKACPNAAIFCIVPPLGWHKTEIAEAVAARNDAGDRNAFLVDTAPLKAMFSTSGGTQLAADGVHPSVFGNAMLGALITAEVQKVLCSQDHRAMK